MLAGSGIGIGSLLTTIAVVSICIAIRLIISGAVRISMISLARLLFAFAAVAALAIETTPLAAA